MRDKYQMQPWICTGTLHASPGSRLLPKVQVAHLHSHPPAPYLADHSPGPGTSEPAPASKLRQASLLRWVGTNAPKSSSAGCREKGVAAALPSQDFPSLVLLGLQGLSFSLWGAANLFQIQWYKPGDSSLPVPHLSTACHEATPNLSQETQVHPGMPRLWDMECQQKSLIREASSPRDITWHLVWLSNKCFRKT